MANSKHQRLSATQKPKGIVVDRISALPDELLSHILSFLPTKYAVGTSILSNRWKGLWTSITKLDFSDKLLFNSSYAYSSRQPNTQFLQFVDRVMLHLDRQRILNFRFKCGSFTHRKVLEPHKAPIKDWISAATTNALQQLDLSIFHEETIDVLPESLFNCNTLVVLKLEGFLVLDISTVSVGFPCLKILHLLGVEYANDECVRKLFASCPRLEDLFICRAEWDNVFTYSICAPALKKLGIVFGMEDIEDPGCNLIINAPALQYLDLYDHVSEDFSLENLSSLVEAKIDVCLNYRRGIASDNDYTENLLKLLRGISYVHSLHLAAQTMNALSHSYVEDAPMFRNLTHLKVEFESYDWDVLHSLLIGKTKKLKTLICTTTSGSSDV